MVRSLSFILTLFTLLSAQERVLLRIGADGRQDAIPLAKGEHAKDAIRRLEQYRSSERSQADRSAGLYDTLRYFSTPAELTTNFGWTHQDVAFQWYVPEAKGVVKEFWWYNYLNRGVVNKGTIRAWNVNPRVATIPASPYTKYIGSYKDAADGDGGVQPFKPASGNRWFYSNGASDSGTYSFDPMLSEAQWLSGGLQVSLDSNVWQGIKLADWGDSMIVNLGEPFGFTVTNDTKKTDIAVTDTRMEILSSASAGAPYHSWKYYETGRTAPENAGWHLRGDYEWGMYVVIEYIGCRAPKITVSTLGNTTSTQPRTGNLTFTYGTCFDPDWIGYVYYKIGSTAKLDSLKLICDGGGKCSFMIPGAAPGDTVYWYIGIRDGSGNFANTSVRSYVVFTRTKPILFIYNNAGFSRSNANLIYLGSSTPLNVDYWSAPTDGTSELPTLMAMYSDIIIADGNFPSRNVFTALKGRLGAATPEKPLSVFFTSQDYGCYITANCADTTFGPGSMEYDYFGLQKIGPQDLPPTNREFRLIPQNDPVTDYLVKFAADSGSKLWYDPTFELGFAGYQDAVVPREGAKILFKDDGTNAMGIKFITPAVKTAFMGFDIGAMQFRGDTSIAGIGHDYKWVPTDVGSVANEFFKVHKVSAAEQTGTAAPQRFVLEQNFPNPFNPSTAIRYSIPARAMVHLSVYNILGQQVAVLMNGMQTPGDHIVEWNAGNAASGIYFYELRSGPYTSVKKMVFMK